MKSSPCSRQGLPFCIVTDVNCGLLPHSFHPFLGVIAQGGIVSVALSLELPLVAVSNCHSLCCPDFPLEHLLINDTFVCQKMLKRSADYWHVVIIPLM